MTWPTYCSARPPPGRGSPPRWLHSYLHRDNRNYSSRTELLPRKESNKHYMRVAELLRSRIESGELPPGAKVSHTAYAAEFGVSVEAVKRACGKLAEVGLLLPGHGHRVVPKPSTGKRWFFLPVDQPEEVAIALREAMTDQEVAALMAALVAASWRQNPIITGLPPQ
ncbi:GntR family transcriptional regulator [Streptomyces sp. NPDC001544]|uniref:GntR family transcriptional regulator n=1 Tax=Streptomyces sp. NPDC001544 TaxID=3364584 RepID=UPI00368A8609